MKKDIEIGDNVRINNPHLNRIGRVTRILESDEYFSNDEGRIVVNRKGEYAVKFEDGDLKIYPYSDLIKV